MAKATYYQRGETLDYKNSGNTVIEANTIIDLGTRIGVAGTSINPDELGDIHVTGVFKIAKTGTDAIAQGAAVYFDGTGITNDNSSTTPAGYAAYAAEAADTEIYVKLLG
ncbi:MAG: DUF2190 family protein [Lachnospiraceae bacterium]|nr:DUF2190 family protein [Lachnospiraceae bacterium]